MKKYIAVTTDGQIVGERATKKDIQFVAQQQAKQLQEVIQVKQYDPWTASYIPIRREGTVLEKRSKRVLMCSL